MTVGLGACSALANLPTESSLSVDGLVAAMKSISFHGASGRVEFGQNRTGHNNQARYEPSVLWAGYNLLSPNGPIWTPELRYPGPDEWGQGGGANRPRQGCAGHVGVTQFIVR